jgi:hypothetical protein
MSGYAKLASELTDWLGKLREEIPAEFHHLVDEGHSIAAKIFGEAKTDATDVEHQAEVAAQPVVRAVESDAGTLAHDAVADAEAAVSGSDKPSA